MAVIGYARVSTTDQKLEVQLEQLERTGTERIYQEKASGADCTRVELAAMIDYAREGDTVIACKLDRLARSTKHLLEIVERLKGKGVTLKILNIDLDTGTPTGKLMLTMLGAIATFEREMMLERQADGIARAKDQGKYLGRKPTAKAKSMDVLELLGKGRPKRPSPRNWRSASPPSTGSPRSTGPLPMCDPERDQGRRIRGRLEPYRKFRGSRSAGNRLYWAAYPTKTTRATP